MAEQAISAPAAVAPVRETRNPFATPRYRIWWVMSVCGAMGVGIQVVTVPLFVRDRVAEDDRAIAIAFALICQTVPAAILALVGGVFADRIDRGKILIRTYSLAAVVSVAYVVLSGADFSGIWPVFILGAVIGSLDAFALPARMSTPPQILPNFQLQNGLILGTVAFMTAFQFAGPSIGGILADGAGLTVAFTAEVIFLAIAAFLATRLHVDPPIPTGKSVRGDMADGLRYLKGNRALQGLIAFNILPGLLLIGPFRVTAVLIVNDIMDASDKWVGLFSGAFGIGVLVGSIAMTMRPLPHRGRILCGAPIIGGIIFIAYGLSEVIPLSMVILIAWGLGAALFINLSTPLIQESASRDMLGRVMSMSSLMFAVGMPLGLAQSGITTSIWGPQASIVISGAIFAIIGVLALLFLKPVRDLE